MHFIARRLGCKCLTLYYKMKSYILSETYSPPLLAWFKTQTLAQANPVKRFVPKYYLHANLGAAVWILNTFEQRDWRDYTGNRVTITICFAFTTNSKTMAYSI